MLVAKSYGFKVVVRLKISRKSRLLSLGRRRSGIGKNQGRKREQKERGQLGQIGLRKKKTTTSKTEKNPARRRRSKVEEISSGEKEGIHGLSI